MVEAPATSASVVLVTNYGNLEIDLWANETPKTCRNFIQLCLDGHYDKTSFPKIINKQMLFCGNEEIVCSIYG